MIVSQGLPLLNSCVHMNRVEHNIVYLLQFVQGGKLIHETKSEIKGPFNREREVPTYVRTIQTQMAGYAKTENAVENKNIHEIKEIGEKKKGAHFVEKKKQRKCRKA